MLRIARTLGVIVLLTLGFGSTSSAQNPPPREALDRVDPVVLLTQGKEIDGKADLKVLRGGFEYFFSTPETKAAFEKTPEKYEIQLGGACARMGPSSGGNPADYLVHDGRIYIFGSDDCHKKFAVAPAKYLSKPAPPMPSSAASARQGRMLVDRLVKAVGSAERLDSITTYVETASQVQKRAQGDVPLTTKTLWRFPGAVRLERTATIQGKTMNSATLLTSAGGWFIGGSGRAFSMRPDGRPEAERQFGRQLVPLLRNRHDAGFKSAAVGADTVGGVKVERLRISNGAVDVTLGVDPATGRLHSMSFIDRNTEGEIGEFTILYADYRTVDGLTLPFSERALFNGTPDDSTTRTISSIAINATLDAAAFLPGPGL
jgi:YHS domain-containing protein